MYRHAAGRLAVNIALRVDNHQSRQAKIFHHPRDRAHIQRASGFNQNNAKMGQHGAEKYSRQKN
jgi:hypothetical protein